MTSGKKINIGAKLRGLIEFPESGTYVLRLRSNDGVRLHIGGKRILQDPGYHNARWLDPVEFVVEQPGWYEFAVDYFQRGGKSGLQVEWTPPGGQPQIIPAAAYAHIPP